MLKMTISGSHAGSQVLSAWWTFPPPCWCVFVAALLRWPAKQLATHQIILGFGWSSWVVSLFIDVCSCGAIWRMPMTLRPTWSDCWQDLVPPVSGNLLSGLNLVVTVLHDSVCVCHCCPVWQTVYDVYCKFM